MLYKLFLNRFETYNDVQSQYLHVRYDRLDVKMFRFNVHGANVWSAIPDHIKNVQTIRISTNRSAIIQLNVNGFVHLQDDATMIHSVTILLNSHVVSVSLIHFSCLYLSKEQSLLNIYMAHIVEMHPSVKSFVIVFDG